MGRSSSGRLETTGFRGNQGLDGKPAVQYRQFFVARLMLGALLRANASVRLSLDRSSTASVLVFKGRDGFRTEVLLDPATGLPSRLRHTDRRVGDDSLIEIEWLLEDGRVTAGVNLPYGVTRTRNGQRFDVYAFDSWAIDLPLKPEDFVLPR